MLRGDNIICGTTTTGTGTLTLAAPPGPPGGIDFDVFARATGIGFGNSAAILVSYTIIEYTDATFATAKSHEKGVGTLTLGGSAGIANCTLARTTKQTSATSLNSQPATQNIAPGTGISIGTAANTLVFIGASVPDLLASFGPYPYDPNSSGIAPLGMSGGLQTNTLVTGNVMYAPFYWHMPMLVKTILAGLNTTYTGGTSSCYGAIYAPSTAGSPGKLLIDFGALGPANPLSQGNFSTLKSASHANGYYLTPGVYWAAIFTVFSGGSGSPTLAGCVGASGVAYPNLGAWLMGVSAANAFGVPLTWASAAATANPAPNPAGLTSFFAYALNGGTPVVPIFWLGP